MVVWAWALTLRDLGTKTWIGYFGPNAMFGRESMSHDKHRLMTIQPNEPIINDDDDDDEVLLFKYSVYSYPVETSLSLCHYASLCTEKKRGGDIICQ